MDTLGTKTIEQKRSRPYVGNRDSGWEVTYFEESGTDGEEEEDEEVKVITVALLRFSWPGLSATTHLTLVGIHGIPSFGQLRQPVVMKPILVAM